MEEEKLGETIGEEWEHEEFEDEELQEESILTVYDTDDFVSGAINSGPYSTIPVDLLEFEHSYGYNCMKYFNLCPCDESVICWAAGSIVTFMDVTTKQTWFRRTSTGGSVGNITVYRKDPNYRLAIAEGREGDRDPLIIVYTWPQMEVDAVLREGTENAYSTMDFSPDGELLASVGKEPDYNLTIWNWKRHKILLRTSAFTYDVNNVMFSPYCEGQLTTAGAAHIKFWKMALTFTGLKLKGELGRFGKTEICDVLGIYPMPDEKVLSGCEWGNILVWEAGLVKVEVTQRGRKVCHGAPIIQFMLSEAHDEVTTIARDGCIRAWYWDTVEQADPPEDDQFVELNPVAETCVPDCQIMSLRHQKDMFWFAQDANGGIWIVELELDKLECQHRKIMTSHSGPVIGIVALRTHPILITAGYDGAIMAYNTETHTLLARYKFPAAISCLLYPPLDVDETSCIIIFGFDDGILRVLFFHPDRILQQKDLVDIRVHSALTIHSDMSDHADIIDMISLLKPHSKSISQITINAQRSRLVTCSTDSSIFIYKLINGSPFQLSPIGFIETPNNIAYMTWKPEEEFTILLCGQVGFIMEAILPSIDIRKYSDITTFKLEFVSSKETLVKKQFMRYRPFPTEEDLASLDEEALKAAAEAADDKEDEEGQGWLGEVQLMESESQLGTTITWAEYCAEGVWVVQKETGALLLIKPGSNKIYKYAPFPDAWCETMVSVKFICDHRYIMLGSNTGYIRVIRMPTTEEDNPAVHLNIWLIAQQKLMKALKGRRLRKEEKQPIPRIDFIDYYYLPMHDQYTGSIRCFEFSADAKFLFTCGDDGNIFAFIINFEEPLVPKAEAPLPEHLPLEKVKEPSTIEGEIMSHEQLKQKEEYDKMMAIANAHKKRVRNQLAEITIEYNKLIRLNRHLPYSQQIDVTLDPRPLEVQERELDELKALAKRKVAHQLEASDLALWKMHSRNIIQLDVFPFTVLAIRDPLVMIRPLRQKNLSQAFWDQLEEVYQKMAEAALKARRTDSTSRRGPTKRTSWGPPRVASFLLGLPPHPPHPLVKQIRNYYERLSRHHVQFIEWQEHLSRKPDPNALPPGSAEALKEAEATIGNRLLKTQGDYVAPPGHNTQLKVCLTRQEIYEKKHAFNLKVLELRDHKLKLVDKMKKIGERLMEIRVEIPPKMAKDPPAIPEIDENLEFPEKNLEIKPEKISMPSRIPTTSKRASISLERRKSGHAPSLYPLPRVRQPKVPRFVPLIEIRPLAVSWEYVKPRSDDQTPYEVEIRERRIERHLYEQDMLLADAEISVQKFDSRLRQLQRERIRVQEKNQLLELHLCQTHLEMNVLNRFEAHEDRLAEKVYTKLMQVKAVQDQIKECELRIQDHISDKVDKGIKCEEAQAQFKKLVHDNKFADFLRRIFKKKYKPPRDKDDDESTESESSSSSSEEEDEGSLDSRDIGPIRLDPNICPEGCDRDVYDKTFELRNLRWTHEQSMMEMDRLVEQLKRDIDAHNKIKRKLSVQLDKRKNDLREFMLEKQSCLNEITGPEGLSKCIVFPEQMLKRLRKRVLEIQEEIRLQKLRAKINRTHLFRMNIDLREMERQAEEIRAQMRDVLTRKLGKPRKVDKTLDELLRQMTRRHKFSVNLKIMPHILHQLRDWRDRYCELEKRYLNILNNYSERLRLAAALQSDIVPVKPTSDPSSMYGGYDINQYTRDVVRLKIVRQQQRYQITALKDEIQGLRFKSQGYSHTLKTEEPPSTVPSEIELFQVPRTQWCPRKKYFPITPLGSQTALIYDVNIMRLIYDALDLMKFSRENADSLLKELSAEVPEMLTGAKSRYEVVDQILKKWLLKHGGDPSQYKKQTRAFDALGAVADWLLRQHIETMEGQTQQTHAVMTQLEEALKDIAGNAETLEKRLGPALAALFQSAEMFDLDTEETMTSLVKAVLSDDEMIITQEMIANINAHNVISNIQACGVSNISTDELEDIVLLAIDCLRAQIVPPDEKRKIEEEVDSVIAAAKVIKDSEVRLSTSAVIESSRLSSRKSSRTSKGTATSKSGKTERTSMESIAKSSKTERISMDTIAKDTGESKRGSETTTPTEKAEVESDAETTPDDKGLD
ncbi:cilia- and flagella-associated protein 44 isoform X2 [Hyposmocoma kahamanoa]|uniref:cilia- and flagella-associated protein 44 isoform X2 n=1 Tax=Hyposmocoma kahamanoa TaxID=1477025 RepID=UPI000E6D706C|nr:cilia- and flagella-associated protein 44 isoform X2 [Hyposmocoma kahamanoa]